MNLKEANILVIGDVMLDRYWYGDVSRLSPEAPVPIIGVEREEYRPGGAANVALNLACLDTKVTLVGITGNDENAKLLEEELVSSKVECHFLKMENSPTISKLRVLGRQQQILRADFEDGFPEYDSKLLSAHIKELWDQCDLVIFSDYAKGCLQNIESLIDEAKQQNKTVLIDPKGSDFGRYAGADIITPNSNELKALVGEWEDNEDLINKARFLAEVNDIEAILVTRGSKGMSWVPVHGEAFHIPTKAREVFDVSGAGDTVIATLGACLAAGCSTKQAIEFANHAAGIVVSKQGTASITVSELFGEFVESKDKPIPLELLKNLVLESKSRGETVVMTNGCFDILHAGHIESLEKARSLGDRLIVAVNSNASVHRLKGQGRPINKLEHRIMILNALSCVDWVVDFGDDILDADTPQSLYEILLPNVLVKGGDYETKDIAGAQAVIEAGGKVVTIELLEELSTTAMVRKLKEIDQ